MKRLILGILTLVLIAGLLYYWLTQNKGEEGVFIRISGDIEVTEVNVGFKISGRIVKLFVQEGDQVTKGKMLAKLDDEDLLQRVELAKAALRSSQARLEKLLAGSRPEELREAEATLQQASMILKTSRSSTRE